MPQTSEPSAAEVAFVTGRRNGKRHRQLIALRRAIDLGEHAHDLGVQSSSCWNGDVRCPLWVEQGGVNADRP